MKSRIIAVFAVAASVTCGVLPGVASAHDSTGLLCSIRGVSYPDALMYTSPSFGSPTIGVLSAGDSFRAHVQGVNREGRTWFYGHTGLGYPNDVWVTGYALYCPGL